MRRSKPERRRESDQRLESFLGTILKRYPRFPMIAAFVLGGLIVAGLLIAFLGR